MTGFVNVVIPPLANSLTYAVPPQSVADIAVGSQVVVPLGKNRKVNGFVVETHASCDQPSAMKAVESVVGAAPCFLPDQLSFFKWVADYYGEPLSNVIDVAIPAAVPEKSERFVRLLESGDPSMVTGRTQRAIIEALRNAGGEMSGGLLRRQLPSAAAALKTLVARGIVSLDARPAERQPQQAAPDWAKTSVELSRAQHSALAAICAPLHKKEFESFLLYGVTGSGKTEVYIEAIQTALDSGRGAIVIVPEIALTPQLVSRFQARLGDAVAVLHSGLSRRSRWEAWKDLIAGKRQVAIGARSAIFAPVHNLGIIIVDEEHDGSFKQQEGLRYNARDIAIVRGKLSGSPVVLGSATPSMESFSRCHQGKMTLLRLGERHSSGSKVSVEIVDLNLLKPWDMPSKHISPKLAAAIGRALERKEQAFLLYNRRGFANYLQCEKCEHVLSCPNCSVTLTYHQFNHALVCHYCFMKMTPPTLCSHCTDAQPGAFKQRGAGTESTQEEVAALFPEARVMRLDRDVVTDLESYERILGAARSGECDILVGTQMIAKGHDLPNVTVGAVIDCDVGLHMPDFRAGERIFQLLTQLSGRAGRGSAPGTVILQTRVPKHPSIQCAARADYERFASIELEQRKELRYPPFFRLLRIVFSSSDEASVAPLAARCRAYVEQFMEANKLRVAVLGPTPCPISRLKAEHRTHMLIKSETASSLISIVRFLREQMHRRTSVKIIYDLDPYEML